MKKDLTNYELLKAIRDRQMTQKQVADRLNIDPTVLSRIITGRMQPTAEERRKRNA